MCPILNGLNIRKIPVFCLKHGFDKEQSTKLVMAKNNVFVFHYWLVIFPDSFLSFSVIHQQQTTVIPLQNPYSPLLVSLLFELTKTHNSKMVIEELQPIITTRSN